MNKDLLKNLVVAKFQLAETLAGKLPCTLRGQAKRIGRDLMEAVNAALTEYLKQKIEPSEKEKVLKNINIS